MPNVTKVRRVSKIYAIVDSASGFAHNGGLIISSHFLLVNSKSANIYLFEMRKTLLCSVFLVNIADQTDFRDF